MELSELTDNAIDHIIENMELLYLNEWEQGFFENVSDRWQRSRKLSDKQRN